MKNRVMESGRLLGLSPEQIHDIMDDMVQEIEPVSFFIGPPHYPGTHYGTVSVIDFDDGRKTDAAGQRRDIERQNNFCLIEHLGVQLGLTSEQIHFALSGTVCDTEPVSLSLGPPQYPGSFYGTVSAKDFRS